MTGYEKIKKFVSEVHEINCALTDEIIEFIDEVILQEQEGGFMPDIKIKQEVEYEVNIDVYCGTCGKGLCGDTTVDNRRMSFTVEACSHCMAEKDEKIKELESVIERLEAAACV